MIQVRELAKAFHGRPVVRGVSFTAPDGAITGLLGANGAGKTTTLRMICGVLQPASGSITVDGDSAGDPLARRRRVGALLDHTGLYPRLTVQENLEYFGRLHVLPPRELADRLAKMLATLGLEAIANRPAARLSQGERMRTALGRAFLHGPQNLVLDEPTNGLDVPSVRSLRQFLRQARDGGACVVFSSHVLEEMRTVCDKVLIIDHGRLMAEGSPAALCQETESTSLEDAFLKLTGGGEQGLCGTRF